MELKLKFNEDAENYDKFRPVYVPELFADINAYAGRAGEALEIGIGTGQATRPFLDSGWRVTAVELGENLARYAAAKFPEVNVVNCAFEDFDSEGKKYDLIYSATAFHWIPTDISYIKCADMLSEVGALAIFWNHPFINREGDPVHAAVRKAYAKYRPSPKKLTEFCEDDCAERLALLEMHGYRDIRVKLYHSERHLTAEEYCGLMNTYSDHRALSDDVKNGLYAEISLAINDNGGILTIYDTIEGYFAKKPR